MNKLTVRNAIVEIKNLRMQNDYMSARLKMFDDMMLLLNTRPERAGQGMSPDICWELEKEIEADDQLQNAKQPT